MVGRPLAMAGAHTTGHNANTIGVCMVGDFDNEPPSKDQLAQLKKLIKDLKEIFPSITKVSFHRDYASKTCPGKAFLKVMVKG